MIQRLQFLLPALYFYAIPLTAADLFESFATQSTANTSTLIITDSPTQPHQITVPLQTIDRQKIKTNIFRNPAELIDAHTHATVVHSGGRHQPTQIFIRGASSDHTLMLLDGIELNDPMHPGRGAHLPALPGAHLQKIELLPSAYSVLYGSNALGGVMSLSSKEPIPVSTGNSMAAEIGRYGYQSLQAQRQTPHYQLGAFWSKDRGFSAKVPRHLEADGHELWSGFLRYQKNIRDWQFKFQSQVQQLRNELDNGIGPADDDPNHASRSFSSIAALTARQWETICKMGQPVAI